MCILLPPWVSDEKPWSEMWLHHICQVASNSLLCLFSEKMSTSMPFLVSLQFYLEYFLHQGDLSTRPLPPRWIFWDAWVWLEEEKPPQHHVLLVALILNWLEDIKKNHTSFRYEDLKQDQEGMLRKIANFTGFALTEDQIKVLWSSGDPTLDNACSRGWTSTWSLTTTRSPVRWTKKFQTGEEQL